MINRTVLVGRLTKEVELKYTQSGVAVAHFTLAVNRPFSNQDGDRQADFINIVVWRKQAENSANFLKKGSLVGIEGRIQTGSYEGQDGKRVYTTEVVADSVQFLEPRGSNTNGQSASNNQNSQSNSRQNYNGGNGQGNSRQQNNGGYNQGNNYNSQNGGYNYSQDQDPFAPNANGNGSPDITDDDLPF